MQTEQERSVASGKQLGRRGRFGDIGNRRMAR